ncbi:MAG: PLP-dependent aminotransferase family protein [Desulfurococcales archaeon]|nr:PLP-dependent aminotransferase family protein [Desulfurococcales archaeon]
MDGYRRFTSKRASLFKASEIRELLKLTEGRNVISLAGGLPDPSVFDARLADLTRELLVKERERVLQYSPTSGVTAFREVLKDFAREKRVRVADDDEVVVTTGSQEALFLLARILVDPGDIVIVEEPTYLAAVNVFKEHGAVFEAVPLDSEGMQTDILEEKLKTLKKEGKKPKLVYLVPTSQNPSGSTMSQERRKHVVELAEEYDLLVIEDDPYSFFTFEPINVDYLKTLDNNGRVIYISSFSKILAPGLRIGWILGPRDLMAYVELAKQGVDLHSSTLSQYIIMEAIKKGIVDDTIERARSIYKAKRDAMMEALDEYMTGLAEWTRPVGGFFTMVYVKGEIDMKSLMVEAVEKYRVAYVPGESFFPVSKKKNTMRLNYSFPSIEEIKEGVKRVASLVKDKLG